MKTFFKATLTLACLGSLAACSGNSNNAKTLNGLNVIDTNGIASNASLTPAQKAEKLALAAEQLSTPSSFMYADAVVDQALAQDPTNKKAQLYKAYLAFPMVTQGILSRIRPLAMSKPESKASYLKSIANIPNHGLKTFLFDGPEDIRSEKELQAFFDEMNNAIDKLRVFVKMNKGLELTINLNDWQIGAALEKSNKACEIKQIYAGYYELSNCDKTHALEVSVGRADLEALQATAAAMQLYIAMINSYDISGSINVAEKSKDIYDNATLFNELSKNSEFGKLRNNGALLSAITGMGVDAIAAVRYFSKIQNQLCPYGRDSEKYDGRKNRPGFLFEDGICVNSIQNDGTHIDELLRTVELALSGQVIETALNGSSTETIQVRPSALLTTPVKDLKLLNPVFNSCGQITAISDDSLSGFLPMKNSNAVLAAMASCQ